MGDIICKQTAKQINSRIVLYSMQRNFKQKVLRRNKRTVNGNHDEFCLNVDFREKIEDSWLNAIKTNIALVNR